MSKTYRQLSHRLRIQRGPGRPDKVSARPREGSREHGWGKFLDSDEEPTLITFDEHDQVNVDALLATGAILEWKQKAKPTIRSIRDVTSNMDAFEKEVDGGEGK